VEAKRLKHSNLCLGKFGHSVYKIYIIYYPSLLTVYFALIVNPSL